MGLKPGHTSSIRRIEAAMLSYHADMTLKNNPFELGMDRLIDLDMEVDFVSKAALTRIRDEGVSQLQVGLVFDGAPISGSNDEYWPVLVDGQKVGQVTSAVYSPRLEQNIALALVAVAHAGIGTKVMIDMSGETRGCEIVQKPFFDPKKAIAAKG